MSLSQSNSNPVNNKLLAKVPREEYDRLLPHLKLVSLSSEQVLYEANELIDYAYFPLTGVSSLLNIMQDGQRIEAATVGNEGMIGIPLLLGTTQTPNMAISQIPGDALQMKADVFQREVYRGCWLHTLLLRYTQRLINQISQTAACNRLHPVEKRCCRWLLMISDRVESDEFFLTPEVLSVMLGVRRTSRSEVIATLQRAGLIRYYRSKMTILDRLGLEATSCECYPLLKEEFYCLLADKPLQHR
jgi:CRP-like cAMP-binding protein